MNKIVFYPVVLVALLSAGCNNNPVLPEETEVVLRGYLYANQPVQDIEVMSSIPIGSTDSINPPIANAVVTLIRNGTSYQLSPTPGQAGYYYYPGNDLPVNTGDDFKIYVSYATQQLSAETVVPPKPVQVALSLDTLKYYVQVVQTNFGTRTTVTSPDTATVTWQNPNGDYFYVTVESIDSSAQPLRDTVTFRSRFVSQPTDRAFYRINNNSIGYTGTQLLRVFRVNKEYANLYLSRQQDSRTLNEPLTNVKGGLGIFSAFASDSLFFYVTRDSISS